LRIHCFPHSFLLCQTKPREVLLPISVFHPSRPVPVNPTVLWPWCCALQPCVLFHLPSLMVLRGCPSYTGTLGFARMSTQAFFRSPSYSVCSYVRPSGALMM
jgi:hypothetical protein